MKDEKINKEDSISSLSKYLKELRINADLSQIDLAEKINIKPEVVKHWERGLEYPDLEMLYTLSGIFQVPCKDLLDKKEKSIQKETSIIRKISAILGIPVYATLILGYIILIGLPIFAFWFIANAHKFHFFI